MSEIQKPECVEDEHLIYLDNLRESGTTNMFGAAPYLVEMYGVSRINSRTILAYWMQTFDDRHPR